MACIRGHWLLIVATKVCINVLGAPGAARCRLFQWLLVQSALILCDDCFVSKLVRLLKLVTTPWILTEKAISLLKNAL